MADNATDRMFEAVRSNWLGTVARTETKGTSDNRRFTRAVELGARYALGGEVRAGTDGMAISIRFEDVPSRLTLWERSIAVPTPDVAYLPAQAARQTAEVMWCIIKTRSALTHDSPEILTLIADRCREGGGLNGRNASYVVSHMRAVAHADPASPYNQSQLAMMLGLGAQYAAPTAQAAWISEAQAALQRADQLDPDEPGIILAGICIALGRKIPMDEWDGLLLDALAKSEGSDAFVFGQASGFRSSLLTSSGRFAEALPHAMAAVANNALASPLGAGLNKAQVGRTSEARAELDPVLAAYGSWVWEPLIPFAFFLNAPDADAMLKSPPSTIPQQTVVCMRVIRKALASKDTPARALGIRTVHECAIAGAVNQRLVLASLAALGDLDGAFKLAGAMTFDTVTANSVTPYVLFLPTSRAMRADPRFLPLVDKMGLMDYWRATKSRPDVCETEAAPFCAQLETAMRDH